MVQEVGRQQCTHLPQPCELGCELVAGRFTPKENSNFEYGVWTPEEEAPRPVALGTVDATLGDDGAAAIECPSPAPGRRLGLRGPARLIGRAAVFEAGGGRTSVGRAEAPVHPERFYLGLASSAAEAKAGADFTEPNDYSVANSMGIAVATHRNAPAAFWSANASMPQGRGASR